ncbi:hypothetical protein BU23DRAFT_499678 [Bimuria novae-zelandiae CBS 107.79]|uniref:Phosphatidate phosphatase APP1 catalytic domain-containing protein n=1 Tax=Bimuria novae-zelandiae CBS 107.79 TaxID=1447943 RepID=A0A6A5VM52_9PLEO|nr:hypothetical protein BU23DRAFT_499678 [Bimuria novae-zelandiae CBS 107.79]
MDFSRYLKPTPHNNTRIAGFVRAFRHRWITPPQPTTESYEGRIIIVTGASSGMGREAAAKFAALGASKVILTARDLKKGEAAKANIEARLGRNDQLEVWELDMNSYDSIIAFSKKADELDHLDVVILNAGVHRAEFGTTQYGWEEDLQVNALSSNLLAILLLRKLKESRHSARKIPVLEFVSSGGHQFVVVSKEIQDQPTVLGCYNKSEEFRAWRQYSASKLFQMYAMTTLASDVSSGDVIITSICPGPVTSDIGRDYSSRYPIISAIFTFILGYLFFHTPEVGANSILSGTTQGEMLHGRFWKYDNIMPVAPSLSGEENKKLGLRVWGEMLQALEKNGVRTKLRAAVSKELHSPRTSIWMPKPRLHKPSAHGTSSLLRYLFPHTSQRARAHLSKFRHELLPSLKHRTQSRIYKYILYRQALKLKKQPGILQRLRGHTRKLLGRPHVEHEARLRREKLTKSSTSREPGGNAMSYQDDYAPREPGARRKKLAGYLKAANELRQTYQQQYAPNWSRSEASYDYEDDTPGSFPDAAIVRNGDEEMILFPSYARKHIKRKPEAEPGTIQEVPGDGRDVRDSAGAGDAEFWKQQWDKYEDDNAVVDVDVRGWIYSPHKGHMSRKQRVFISLARQLVGIQAPPAGTQPSSASDSPRTSRDPSPGNLTHRERAQLRQSQRDDQLTAKEAEEILRRGEKEAETAAKGAYSEKPLDDVDSIREYRAQSPGLRGLSHSQSNSSLRSTDTFAPPHKRASWNQPADMSPSELAEAHARLMARLRHFLAIPMANTPISVFFYNDQISKQRTAYTNASGHFSISAALDFVPTHIRILASDKLSATEEVIVTESNGVSVISDIDDTIKHSAISSGAREIFRNAFIRDLSDLTIDGVREWYNKMAEMGVKFHYVSNSPWQLYPVISKYFSLAGLPPGSFHLKQYSGMLQGIFEPVAERKKGTLDKISRDFPERKFILVGDSGEADLEVYTDFVLENPGRVIAVLIRDVTSSDWGGFFDPSIGSAAGNKSTPSSQQGSAGSSNKFQASSEEDDPELKAAIAASLREVEEDNQRRSRSLFPQLQEDHPESRPQLPPRRSDPPRSPPPIQNLIDVSPDEEPDSGPNLRRVNTDSNAETLNHRAPISSAASAKSVPVPPRKPLGLSSSGDSPTQSSPKGPPPPKPRKPSANVNQSSPLSQQTSTTSATASRAPQKPPTAPKPNLQSQQSYSGYARDKLYSAYNHLPSAPSYLHSDNPNPASANQTTTSSEDTSATKRTPPPPPPPRRGLTAYPAAAAGYVGSKAHAAWQYAPPIPHPSTRPNASITQPFSTSATTQLPHRTNTGSTLGSNGYGEAGRVIDKREQLWRQRWARAEQVLGEQGVILKSWKVGGDIEALAQSLIRENTERERGEGEGQGRGRY